MSKDDVIAAHNSLRRTLRDLTGLAHDRQAEVGREDEPWRCHPDYPDRVAAEIRRAADLVALAAAEWKHTLVQFQRAP